MELARTASPAARAGLAGALAAGLVLVGWFAAGVVGWLDWRPDYGAGADDLWQQNLTAHGWVVATGVALAAVLAVRSRVPGAARPATPDAARVAPGAGSRFVTPGAGSRFVTPGAVAGGLVAALGLSGWTAGHFGYDPGGQLYLMAVFAAAVGGGAALLAARSAGGLPGVLTSALLTWAFALFDPLNVAFVEQPGVPAFAAPAICTGVPAVVAVLVAMRAGAGWPTAFLGSLAAPVLLLAAYRFAGPDGGDHLGQLQPYSYVHVVVPLVVLGTALLGSRVGPRYGVSPHGVRDTWRGIPAGTRRTCVIFAVLVGGLVVLTTDRFELDRQYNVSFAAQTVTWIVAAVGGVLAWLAAAVAVSYELGSAPDRSA